MSKKGRKVSNFLAALLLCLGLGVLAYPMVSNYVNQQHSSYAIQDIDQQVEALDESRLAGERALAEAYNAALAAGEGEPGNYEAVLNFGNGVMGYLQIPRIGVELPIYHGTDGTVLSKGVGHLQGTALPIGGEGNHAVLSGHRGLPSAALFTRLPELELGDRFQLHVLGETLTYEVEQIQVVLPEETEALLRVPGQDYCTLVTCTPYGINTHRLLIRGRRVVTAGGKALTVEADGVELRPTVVRGIAATPVVLLLLLPLLPRRKPPCSLRPER